MKPIRADDAFKVSEHLLLRPAFGSYKIDRLTDVRIICSKILLKS